MLSWMLTDIWKQKDRYSKDFEDLVLVSEVGGFLSTKITEGALELLTHG